MFFWRCAARPGARPSPRGEGFNCPDDRLGGARPPRAPYRSRGAGRERQNGLSSSSSLSGVLARWEVGRAGPSPRSGTAGLAWPPPTAGLAAGCVGREAGRLAVLGSPGETARATRAGDSAQKPPRPRRRFAVSESLSEGAGPRFCSRGMKAENACKSKYCL